ncbi:MAG: GNAT family N-acetyltransferase [Streptococcaceae bacterium]|jgi:GNAT superfamily N-acetyltransferase|nr:GNAT family N-acetyltransferase [Streptococcaceae bacterium]
MKKMKTLTKNFYTKTLTIKDSEIIEQLFQQAKDYFLLSANQPPSKQTITSFFQDVPPNKTSEDKLSLGLFIRENELIAVADIIKNFPKESTWIIGLLLIAPKYRGQNIGFLWHEELEKLAFTNGADTLQLGVVKQNEKARHFWQNQGYVIENEIQSEVAGKRVIIVRMKKELHKKASFCLK